jgi:hypothetical protein
MNKNHRPIVGSQRNVMAHKPISMPVEKGKTYSPTTKSPALAELARDYQTATEQYGVIVRYLKAAIEVLPKPECQLLLEFAEIEKTHCERLHAELQDRLVPGRRVHNARGQHTFKTTMGRTWDEHHGMDRSFTHALSLIAAPPYQQPKNPKASRPRRIKHPRVPHPPKPIDINTASQD